MPHKYNQPEEVRQRGLKKAQAKGRETRSHQREKRIQRVTELLDAEVPIQEIAIQFGVNPRTIYRDEAEIKRRNRK